MSECVVRMEMPENCHECPVSHQSFGDTPCWCKLAFEKNEAVSDGLMWREVDPQTRPDWCPIICQLPEGHGRLVDKDEVIESIRTEVTELFFNGLKGTPRPDDDLRFMWNRLEDEDFAPTIVPAERSE